MKNKTIIFLADGMADESLGILNNKTPLQFAKTPAMDSIAFSGNSGTLLTLPEGFPSSSEVANMSILGCDLEHEYCGRGPLEALGQGLDIEDSDHVFRLNLTTQEKGVLIDFSGANIDQQKADFIISKLNNEFGSKYVSFHSGISYRNLLILSGPNSSHNISTEKPDDNQGNRINDHLPSSHDPAAQQTINFLFKLIQRAPEILRDCSEPSNGVWPWGGGSLVPFKSLKDKYDIRGAVISETDVIKGLGKCLGMDVISINSATHQINTSCKTKTEAALQAFHKYDFLYIHEDSMDEASHKQDLELKIKAIEDFDEKIVAPILEQIDPNTNLAILPDHPASIATGKHTRTPVPVSVRIRNGQPDSVQRFDEDSCKRGSLGAMSKDQLMRLLLDHKGNADQVLI